MKGSDIITRVGTLLHDESHVRWTSDELMRHITDGQKAICAIRPDAHSVSVEVALVEGAIQTVPATATRLLDVTHNVTINAEDVHVPGRAVSITDREEMDRFDPAWRTARKTKVATQFMHDANLPTTFYVNPPNNGEGLVAASVAQMPADPADVDEVLALDDRWLESMVNYVAAKCYAKDGEFVPRAGEYMQLFVASLTGEYAATISSQPNATKAGGKPDTAAQQTGGV